MSYYFLSFPWHSHHHCVHGKNTTPPDPRPGEGLAWPSRASPPEPNSVGASRVEPTSGGLAGTLNSPSWRKGGWNPTIFRRFYDDQRWWNFKWCFLFCSSQSLQKWSNLTMIFQMGWNHRLVFVHFHLVFTGNSSMFFFANGWNTPFFGIFMKVGGQWQEVKTAEVFELEACSFTICLEQDWLK